MNKKVALVSSILVIAVFAYLSLFTPDLTTESVIEEIVKPIVKLTPEQLKKQQNKSRVRLDKLDLSKKEKAFVLANLDSSTIEEISNPLALVRLANISKATSEGYGDIPAIKFDNPQAKKLKEALDKPQKYPERISPMIAAKPFDWQLFQNNTKYRKEYLDSPEPARAKAHGDDKFPKLVMLSPFFQRVEQNKSIKLKFQGIASSPYTVTTYDAGQFSNNLTTQTKVANTSGYIEFDFFATSGVIEAVNISCAGPQSSNVIHALIQVEFNRDNL